MALSDTRLAVFGGMTQSNEHRADVHVYDTASNAWVKPKNQSNAPTPRGFGAAGVCGKKVVIACGATRFVPDLGGCAEQLDDVHVFDIGSVVEETVEVPRNEDDKGGAADGGKQ